jgi:hypothetical protein
MHFLDLVWNHTLLVVESKMEYNSEQRGLSHAQMVSGGGVCFDVAPNRC